MNKKSVFLFACLSMTIISLAMLLPQKKQKVVRANIQTKPKTVNKLNSKKDIKPNQKETMAVSNKIEKQPDILFFLADDMMSIACEPYGSPDVHTPNLAQLAKEGICFDNMNNATAMCGPTRQSLYTGLFPVKNGSYPKIGRAHV